MLIYAGIDEAGYGPIFGPLTVGRFVLAMEEGDAATLPDAWKVLKSAVCRKTTDKRKRIPIADSKKLHSKAKGLRHLELGVLSFAGLMGVRPASVDRWLDALGETRHRELAELPWYAATADEPWAALPVGQSLGELTIARAMLERAAKQAGVRVIDMGGHVVYEDEFNRMVAATRSKAATSFTFVARHLQRIWDRFGKGHPCVIVDRQGGRTHYRELLSTMFPQASMRVIEETTESSAYEMTQPGRNGEEGRSMTVRFEVAADDRHMPVALASMLAKYTRELLMARFQKYFAQALPEVKPTAGYGADAKRFWHAIAPRLDELAIDGERLRRRS